VNTPDWNVVGLILNLIGVILLFRYGMPYRVRTVAIKLELFREGPMRRPSVQTNKAHFLAWPNLRRGRLNSDRRPARFGALLHRTLLPT